MATRTTELEALNVLLMSVNAPLEASTSDLTGEAAKALAVLRETSKTVQAHGWEWNTDYGVALSPDSDGYLMLGSDVIRCDQTDGAFTEVNVTQRGDKLYDRKNNTFVFTSDITVTQVRAFDWELLPEAARKYITLLAARLFRDRVRGDNKGRQSVPTDEEVRALIILQEAEADNADYNIFDAYSTYSILDRSVNATLRDIT